MERRDDSHLLEVNRDFYEPLWREARLLPPEIFNTWSLVGPLASRVGRRLEVAPGLRPRLPLAGTVFADISRQAAAKIAAGGGGAVAAAIGRLPFADGAFELVCALDIIEHVDDDDGAMAELARVCAAGATLLLSTPLHPELWTAFDDFVGHRRRYPPKRITALLREHGFRIEQSAVFGLKPRSSLLTDIGMWFLRHRREKAMRWYNRVLPYCVRRQKPLHLHAGLIGTDNIGEVFLVCRKAAARGGMTTNQPKAL